MSRTLISRTAEWTGDIMQQVERAEGQNREEKQVRNLDGSEGLSQEGLLKVVRPMLKVAEWGKRGSGVGRMRKRWN